MALTKAILAPQGVAYVSYNVLPGGRIRQMFREMMLFHLGGETEFEACIEGARQMVQWFRASQPKEGKASLLAAQVDSVMERTPQVLFHDELNPEYHSVYFQEFAAHAARAGLQFLSEANYFDGQPRALPASVVAEIDRVAKGDRIVREQYFDFMKCRMFRQTLLCHQEIVLPAAPLPARLACLRAASTAKPVSKRPDLSPGVAEEFRGWKGTGVTTAHPLTKAVMLLLAEAWPQTVSISDLAAAAARRTGEPPDPEGLAQILLSTYAAGVVDLHTQPRHCVGHVSQFPVASALARSQVRRGRCATTALHVMMESADARICAFIDLLDGTRDIAALVRELAPSSQLPEAELAHGIQENLKLLAERGLLVA
jgi:methyltransferase-like protein